MPSHRRLLEARKPRQNLTHHHTAGVPSAGHFGGMTMKTIEKLHTIAVALLGIAAFGFVVSAMPWVGLTTACFALYVAWHCDPSDDDDDDDDRYSVEAQLVDQEAIEAEEV